MPPVRPPILAAARHRYRAQLLLRRLPAEDARRVRQQWHAEHDPATRPGAVQRRAVYRGDDWDDLNPHLWNFFQAVKRASQWSEDAVFGNHAAIACHMANESYFRKKPVYWDAANKRISS